MTGVSIEVDRSGVARVTLDRPERHNVLSGETCDALRAAAEWLGSDPGVRVVVLASTGASFCAGGDLAWMRAQLDASRTERTAEARRVATMLQALNTIEKPLIGRVQGAAYGGGVGLVAVCDAVIAVEGVRFALTETRLGLIPATIGPYVLARIGEGRARAVFFSGRPFDSADAARLGLVTRAVKADALDDAVAAEVDAYLSTSPAAVAAAKRHARSLGPRIDDAVIDASVERLADVWETEDARAGISAFLDKRPPPWVRG